MVRWVLLGQRSDMAMLIIGSAKCAVCKQLFKQGDDTVSFPWFELGDTSLQAFSDAGVHFSCLTNHPRRTDLQVIFLQELGHDGVRPNGQYVQTVSPFVRVSCGKMQVVIAYGPLFLVLPMPQATALAWKNSRFWEPSRERQFVDKGLEATVIIKGLAWELAFRLCPFGFTPYDAVPRLIRSIVRQTSISEGEKAIAELFNALSQIKW